MNCLLVAAQIEEFSSMDFHLASPALALTPQVRELVWVGILPVSDYECCNWSQLEMDVEQISVYYLGFIILPSDT